jgi:hypothetical protein
MQNKKLLVVSGAVLAALLLVSAVGATAVFAQEPDPEAEPNAPLMQRFGGMLGGRRGGFGGGMLGERANGPGPRMDTLAEALGLTPEEIFAELREGKTIEEIAEAQGVDLEALQETAAAEREQAMRDSIAKAVAEGTMSEEQAAWTLEGLDKGFLPGLRGFGGGRWAGMMRRGFGCSRGMAPAEAEPTADTST